MAMSDCEDCWETPCACGTPLTEAEISVAAPFKNAALGRQLEASAVHKRKIWIESDFLGSQYVMIQHEDGVDEPFCYCAFNYDYAHTSNSTIRREAESMAERLGAEKPIERILRPID